MIYWLAQAAKEARESAGRMQVHVAASMNKDQSTVYRFEQGQHWPRNTDEIVAAYADDLDLEPQDLWERALELWRCHDAAARTPTSEAINKLDAFRTEVAGGTGPSEADDTQPVEGTEEEKRARAARRRRGG